MLNYEFVLGYVIMALVSILLIECTKNKVTEGMEPVVEEDEAVVEEVEPVEPDEPVEEVVSPDGESGSLMDSLIDMAGNLFTFIVHVLTLVLLIYIAMKVRSPSPPTA